MGGINNILKLSCFFPLFMLSQSKPQKNYQCKATEECIDYIEKYGLTIFARDSFLFIESEQGLLYSLPTGEIVLIPSDLNKKYVGFIYKNKMAFQEMRDKDYFPVDEKYLTFWEMERDWLKQIPESVSHYSDFLIMELKMEQVPNSLAAFKESYDLLTKYVKRTKTMKFKDKLILSYAIITMNYLVNNNQAKWDSIKRYETYNSYQYPLLKSTERKIDVLSSLYSTIEQQKGNFQLFCDFIGLKWQ